MAIRKILYCDCETFALDPKVASVRELAFSIEIDGKPVGELQAMKVQPVLHAEDKLYGHIDITRFCADYNKRIGHPSDPDCLTTFGFPDHPLLFFHSRAALTFNLPPPQIINPTDWLIGKDIVTAQRALSTLIDALEKQSSVPGRWVLAGHNIKYDYEVLTWWSKRVLGEEEAKLFLDKFNKYIFLDTLMLCRWMQYSGRLKTEKANLGAVAQELGIDASHMHSAKADVYACREVARTLLGMDDAREQ